MCICLGIGEVALGTLLVSAGAKAGHSLLKKFKGKKCDHGIPHEIRPGTGAHDCGTPCGQEQAEPTNKEGA